MASYPSATPYWDSPRDLSNPSAVAEVTAIATELGVNPKGSDASVNARLIRIDVTDPSSGVGLRTLSGTGTANTGSRSDHNHDATYEATANRNANNGYAGISLATSLIPGSRLGTGTADSTTFLRGDGVWVALSGTAGLPTGAASGDLGLTYPSPMVVSMLNRVISSSATPNYGSIYEWDNTNSVWTTAKVGTHQYIVAASNSPAEWRTRAAYQCTGTDDQTVINTASVDATKNGTVYGEVILAPGTYNVNLTAHPGATGYFSAIRLKSKTHLRSNGRHAAVIKLTNGQSGALFAAATEDTFIITNTTIVSAASPTLDTDITVEGITVDGNASNNSGGTYSGIGFNYLDGGSIVGCVSKNCRATLAIDRWQYKIYRSRNIVISNSIATHDDAGPGASGFMWLETTNGNAAGLFAYSNGFNGIVNRSAVNLMISDCLSYNNGGSGARSEYSRNILYNNCVFGSKTNFVDTNWSATNLTLGNGDYGLHIVGTEDFQLNNIICNSNTIAGFNFDDTADGVKGPGLTYRGNASNISATSNAVGFIFLTAGAATSLKMRNFRVANNGVNDAYTPTYSYHSWGGEYGGNLINTPAIPTSGSSVTNPYPFRVCIYISVPPGSSAQVAIDSSARIIGSASSFFDTIKDGGGSPITVSSATVYPIMVEPGQTVHLTYTGTPTWKWWVEG